MDNFFSTDCYENYLGNCDGSIREFHEKEREVLENFEPDSKILDVGCGYGRHMQLLSHKAEEVWGIDENPAMIGKAKENLAGTLNATLLLGNAKKINAKNGTFDRVICMANTFGNFDALKKEILLEMKRVCKERGKIIVSVYSENALDARLDAYLKANFKIERVENGTVVIGGGLVSEQFSKQQLAGLACECGLKCEIQELTPISYLCEFTKR